MSLNKPIVQESKQIKFTQLRIIKNLAIICLTFVFLFSAYDGLSMLQSTMNGKGGMGSYSQALVYITFAVACLLIPNYSIKKLGCKINLFVGTLMYIPYIASNAYPTWVTMLSSAVLIGIGASMIWAAQCKYCNELAGLYYNLLNDCVKTPPKDCKSPIKNSKMFIIQDGISQKVISEMKDQLTQLDHVIKSRTSSRTDSLKIIPEVKTLVINTKIDCDINVVIDGKTENNYCANYNPFDAIKREKSRSFTDSGAMFENQNLQSEQYITKDYEHNTVTNMHISNKNPTIFTADADINMRHHIGGNTISNTSRSSLESVTSRFFGCFGLMYCTAQIWSNLLSYYVLNIGSEENRTRIANYSCGASFCNNEYETSSNTADEVPLETRYLLIGITSTLSVTASLLVLVFLDPLNTDEEPVTFSLSHLLAAFNQLRKREQIYIIPLSMFSGLNQGFFTADFTKSYIQCAWNISHVGLVTVFYGLTSGTSSSISGWAVKYLGRIPVVLFGLVLHLGTGAFLLHWNPDSENPLMFYLAAGLLGTVVGLFYSQISSFYGLLFKNDEETAFATHYFCSAMGWTLAFIYSDYLCTSIKIYILMIMSCLGIFGYLAADRSFRSRSIQ